MKVILNPDEYAIYLKRCAVEEKLHAPNIASNHALKTVFDMVTRANIYAKTVVEQEMS